MQRFLILLTAFGKPIVDYEATTRVSVGSHVHHEAYRIWFGDYAIEYLVDREFSHGRLRSGAVVDLSLRASFVVLGHGEVLFPLMGY
jgi:hypothetical protein